MSSSDFKQHARIEIPDDDSLVLTYIESARRETENKLDRTLINTTWVLRLDEFPCGNNPLPMPRPPLSSVTSITYTDTAGTSTTWASSNYTVDANSEPGRIYPAYGQTWPSTRSVPNAVVITYVAGYGSSATSVPGGIRAYILRKAAELYEQREMSTAGVISEFKDVDGLLDPYRWGSVV